MKKTNKLAPAPKLLIAAALLAAGVAAGPLYVAVAGPVAGAGAVVPVPPAGPEGPGSPPLKVRFADPDDGWIFSSLPGQAKVQAWSTHDGGRHWLQLSILSISAQETAPQA